MPQINETKDVSEYFNRVQAPINQKKTLGQIIFYFINIDKVLRIFISKIDHIIVLIKKLKKKLKTMEVEEFKDHLKLVI